MIWVIRASHPTGAVMAIAACSLVLGALMLGPVLARPVMAVLALPFRLIRPLGRLALRNALANPRRSAITSAALMVGVILVTAGSVVAATVKASTSDLVDSELSSDLVVSSIVSRGVPTKVVDEVSHISGVDRVSSDFTVTTALVGPEGKQGKPDMVLVLPKDFRTFIAPKVTSGDVKEYEQHPASSMILSKGEAERGHLKVGSRVVVTGNTGQRTLTVRAIIDSATVEQGYMVPPDLPQAIGINAGERVHLFVTVKDGTSVDTVKHAIDSKLASLHMYQVQDRDEFKGELAGQVNKVLGILYALLGLSIVIAILGIINTLSLSISERVREIGLLRAVGMSRSSVAFMVVIESILISVFGTVLGLILGTACAYGLCSYLSNDGLSSVVVPWGTLVIMAVAAVVVGTLAAIAPAVKAVRYKLLDAIARA